MSTGGYLGDMTEDQSFTFHWNTFDVLGASITRATDGTVKVVRSDGTDCTATSVTDTEDTPDTGIHRCTVDTSDNANYATGYDYTVWVDSAVVDGRTVNVALADFSIQNRYMRGTDSAALASVATEARLAELDAANIPADVDALSVAANVNATGTVIVAQDET